MRGKSVFKRGRRKSPNLKDASGLMFSYYKKTKRDLEGWTPTYYRNWIELIKRFGVLTPAREFCNEEIFLSRGELNASRAAYIDALEVFWTVEDKSYKQKTIDTVNEIFKGAIYI